MKTSIGKENNIKIYIVSVICGLVPLVGVTIMRLADRTDLFKNSKLVQGGNCN